MATHSSIPAWRIPWTEEPGGLQSTGSQRVRHDLGTKQEQQQMYENWFALLAGLGGCPLFSPCLGVKPWLLASVALLRDSLKPHPGETGSCWGPGLEGPRRPGELDPLTQQRKLLRAPGQRWAGDEQCSGKVVWPQGHIVGRGRGKWWAIWVQAENWGRFQPRHFWVIFDFLLWHSLFVSREVLHVQCPACYPGSTWKTDSGAPFPGPGAGLGICIFSLHPRLP